MPRWEIKASAVGEATVIVEADTDDDAIQVAYSSHLTGIIIDGGEMQWDIEAVEQVDDDAPLGAVQ